jgi:IgGFc binding protein
VSPPGLFFVMRITAAAVVLAIGACGAGSGHEVTGIRPPPSHNSMGGSAPGAPGGGFTLPEPRPPGSSTSLPPGSPTTLTCGLPPDVLGNAGCSFYTIPIGAASWGCDLIYVVNPGAEPVHVKLSYHHMPIPVARYGRLARLTFEDTAQALFDEAAGIPPGEALVISLNASYYGPGGCPVQAVSEYRGIDFWPRKESAGVGDAYHLTTDRPVVAYGFAGSSASLLLPQESWGKTTVVATPRDSEVLSGPYVAVMAAEDDTEVLFRPTEDIVAIADPAQTVRRGVTERLVLQAGEYAQFAPRETRPRSPYQTPSPPLSGSIVSASKPVGVMGSSRMFRMPLGSTGGASHQQLPPLEALGHEYVAVRYPDRSPGVEEDTPWQIVGAADGIELTYIPSPPRDAPLALSVGQVAHFWSRTPFIVRSQDDRHPFYLGGYMTGQPYPAARGAPGAPVLVNAVPTAQFDRSYVFFIGTVYPESRLVVVRKKGADGHFGAVKLGCAAEPLAGFRPLGELEYTQVVLRSQIQPAIPDCDRPVHSMEGGSPFSVTVWTWVGSPSDRFIHSYAHAYPAGARGGRVNVAPPIVID